jgi:hypothetical protein
LRTKATKFIIIIINKGFALKKRSHWAGWLSR